MITSRSSVQLLLVPYDSGQFDVRMGAGPLALARAGAAQRLREQGHAVDVQVLEPASAWRAELRTAFELHRSVAETVAAARAAGRLPLVLSGNCNTTVGVLAGLAGPRARVGMIWLDAHGDFNTPEEDSAGFLDGQGLAMAVGRCWTRATARLPGFAPLPEQNVLLVGARDLDEVQQDVLRRSAITWLPPAQARDTDALVDALDVLADRVDLVHLHVDLDVHDPSVAPANSYAAADGLSAEQVRHIVRLTADRLPIVVATLASYDPTLDTAGRMSAAALNLLQLLAGVADTSGAP